MTTLITFWIEINAMSMRMTCKVEVFEKEMKEKYFLLIKNVAQILKLNERK